MKKFHSRHIAIAVAIGLAAPLKSSATDLDLKVTNYGADSLSDITLSLTLPNTPSFNNTYMSYGASGTLSLDNGPAVSTSFVLDVYNNYIPYGSADGFTLKWAGTDANHPSYINILGDDFLVNGTTLNDFSTMLNYFKDTNPSGSFQLPISGQMGTVDALTVVAVPEPSTFALVAIGSAALVCRRRVG